MIRPVQFRMNEETAVNNYYQKDNRIIDANTKAQQEFDTFVAALQKIGTQVVVIDDDIQCLLKIEEENADLKF